MAPDAQQDVSEQQDPPLQQGSEQQLSDCFLCPMANAARCARADLLTALADLALAASQQGSSQHATLQHAVSHFEASQQLDFGAANAVVTNVRARARPASLYVFNEFSCVDSVADEM